MARTGTEMIEAQIRQLRERFPDRVIIVRTGDECMAFGDDAKLIFDAADGLDMTLDCATGVVTFPATAEAEVLKRIHASGRKAAIAEAT